MNKDKKPSILQLRISREEKRGADLAEKLEKIAKTNGLSINDVANLAVAAGLSMVEQKLSELKQTQAAA